MENIEYSLLSRATYLLEQKAKTEIEHWKHKSGLNLPESLSHQALTKIDGVDYKLEFKMTKI